MDGFSLLELSPIPEGLEAADAIANTIDLAIKAEAFGYDRFWLAEHHNIAGIASTATAVLIGRIAAATRTMRVGSGGIMLPKSRGRHDVEELDRQMTALEAENGIEPGSTPVIALVTETAAAMFTTGDYGGAPRLAAMTWGAEDLADSLGAQSNRDFDGDFAFTYKLARSLCLLGAVAADVMPIETIDTNFRDLEGLRKRAIEVRRQGYRGMLAIHPAQVPVINEAFSPSEEEIAEAREIIALFEAKPDAGTIGWKGGMLDRPHLSRARQLLAQVEG